MGNAETSSQHELDDSTSCYETNLWIVKRGSFNGYTNTTIFQSRCDKSDFEYVANNAKNLRLLRHPNILKYLCSKEQPQISSCILVTEPVDRIESALKSLQKEQLLQGLYSITTAIDFLHNKAQISHNNICESNIFINTMMTWKLGGMELSVDFSELSLAKFLKIKPVKSSFCILPEEESQNQERLSLLFASKGNLHAIDAYCWALMLSSILSSCADELNGDANFEKFLSIDPSERPEMSLALTLNMFKPSRSDNTAEKSRNLFTLRNLFHFKSDTEIDAFLQQVVNELFALISRGNDEFIDEKMIEFLLSPYMFFFDRMREHVLPLILTPKSHVATKVGKNVTLVQSTSASKLFIGDEKYKTYVLPRVLNLFRMRSFAIRATLLEFFDSYLPFIQNLDALRYDILPELLVGLKDENDELVSLTFLALASVVKILGHGVVVGSNKAKKRYFSANKPKFDKSFTNQIESNLLENNAVKTTSEESDELENILGSNEKQSIISESMIALNEFQINEDWSNNFDWHENSEAQDSIQNDENFGPTLVKTQSEKSIDKLQGKTRRFRDTDELGSEFEIKKLPAKEVQNEEEDFFKDMQPVIRSSSNFMRVIDVPAVVESSSTPLKAKKLDFKCETPMEDNEKAWGDDVDFDLNDLNEDE